MSAKLSVIIPTYCRPELLNFGLHSLAMQTFPIPFEIIVLNDGIKDQTEEVCNKYKKVLNIKYIFTGQRNLDGMKWRVPGAVFNEGVKIAEGEYLILSNPEIYHFDNRNIIFLISPLLNNSKLLTVPYGKDDTHAEFLEHLKRRHFSKISYNMYNILKTELNTKLPFCMGMKKNQFNAIGGYDPIYFDGYCFDDDDFIHRLLKNGCNHYQSEAKIIHLYHSRKREDRIGLTNRNELWKRNQKIFIDSQIEDKIPNNKITDIVPKISVEEIKLLPFPLSAKVNSLLNLSLGTPQIDDNKIKQEIILPKNDQSSNILPQSIEIKEIKTTEEKWYLEKIPKIAHFYWGEKKLPYLRYLTIWSFHKYNPDWEIRFYYPKYRQPGRAWKTHEHNFIFKGKDYYPELKQLPIKFYEVDFEILGFKNDVSEVYKANYLEYHLLHNVGGLFSDTDILYFSSINNIPVNIKENKNAENIFSILWHGHTMGFLLSSPHNKIYGYLLEKLSTYFTKFKNNYQCIGTLMLDEELGKTVSTMRKKFFTNEIYNLSPKTIYAYNIGKIKELFKKQKVTELTDYSIGIHWYGGHLQSMKYINEINDSNITNDIVLNKIVNISLGKEKLNINNENKLTIHCVVRNEPFIYYSIKSVYPYAKKILLYDTGSYDTHTLEDIQQLLKEDTEKKIVFKQIPIDSDETQWSLENLKDLEKQNKGKFNLGSVRQLMIEATDTEFFLILDADEVYYYQTMQVIINEIIPNFPEDIYLIATPLNWFYDLSHIFIGAYTFPFSGGIYRTDKVVMNDISPNEHHLIKGTNEILCASKYKMNWTEGLIPYAHFETFLKPYRRKHLIKPEQIIEFKEKLPEVMETNKFFIERFLQEKK